ncbi:hypothetical protein [Acetobacter oeni]|uniref:Uncharacterized protein n=1 Tax=Acetobacter oeni TaxID=304077 RepID=A0A511XHW4_9PROT|nr:hypothetical protein [Acetobacter oeni]MBB3882540.1 hypothetical protein [Acetobacter oeni]NHO18648.1 hypothetical protein [Acetobacter oeni]GEN62523.1 hypothetical protein AOE01nite_07470 [Acetobacter oeni]
MVAFPRFSAVAVLAVALLSGPLAGMAFADPGDPLAGAEMTSGDPTQQDGSAATKGIQSHQHEHLRVKGRRSLPPGYQEAPSMDIEHGADPEHEEHIRRDSVTGADLSRFGSSYQDTGPNGTGTLGDSTGNGWVAPR